MDANAGGVKGSTEDGFHGSLYWKKWSADIERLSWSLFKNPCFDELWFEILSLEMCIYRCVFLLNPTTFPRFLVTVTGILFFCFLHVEFLDIIADFEVDLIALSSALHACGIASRWEEASPGNGAMGNRYFQGGFKGFDIGARWDGYIYIYIEKILCEETMAKTLWDL